MANHIEDKESAIKDENSTNTVIVSHLPTDSSVEEVKKFFGQIGPLKRCFLVRDYEKNVLKGIAYVTYLSSSDANNSVTSLNGKVFKDNRITVKFSQNKEKSSTFRQGDSDDNSSFHHKPATFKRDSEHLYFKPQSSGERVNKKGRLVVRNLAFNVSEDELKTFFETCGDVREVTILKKPNGMSKGVGFVQFEDYSEALNAIEQCNMKVFHKRTIAVDLAVPKKQYDMFMGSDLDTKQELDPMQLLSNSLQQKNENTEKLQSQDEMMIKQEKSNVAEETTSIKDEKITIKEESLKFERPPLKQNDDIEIDEEEEQKENADVKPPFKKIRREFTGKGSRDVTEGRSLFVKNLSLETDQETVKELFSSYGPVRYVRFCIDRDTERFKGSAFIEFQSNASVEDCMEAFDDPACKSQFILGGRSILVLRAISRGDLHAKKEAKSAENDKKDRRNIYLAREGVIREGTQAAKEVSIRDMKLRTQREILKRKLLANFSTFVSPTRLFIQNLPRSIDDAKLKDIFRNNSPEDALITECRIMRNLQNLGENGIAKSKGFGFVTFDTHENALHALRTVNNNPNVLTKKQRPIVEFSIENRKALEAREKRMIRSQQNVKKKQYKKKNGQELAMTSSAQPGMKGDHPSFSGSKYDPKKKGFKALSSRIGPKIRHRDRKITRNAVNNSTRRKFGSKNKKIKRTSKGNQKKGVKKSKKSSSKLIKGSKFTSKKKKR